MSRITNEFRKIEFWPIPPKQPFKISISRNNIKKSASALHFEKYRKVRNFEKKKISYFIKLVQISNDFKEKYERAKFPVDFISHIVRRVPKHQDFVKSSSKIYFISNRSKTSASFSSNERNI